MDDLKTVDREIVEITSRLREWIKEELTRLGVSPEHLENSVSAVMIMTDQSIVYSILSVSKVKV